MRVEIPILKLAGHHNNMCDIIEGTIRSKRAVKKGEPFFICSDCYEKLFWPTPIVAFSVGYEDSRTGKKPPKGKGKRKCKSKT